MPYSTIFLIHNPLCFDHLLCSGAPGRVPLRARRKARHQPPASTTRVAAGGRNRGCAAGGALQAGAAACAQGAELQGESQREGWHLRQDRCAGLGLFGLQLCDVWCSAVQLLHEVVAAAVAREPTMQAGT